MEWTTELTVGFVPLPPEKEEAYWAAIHFFAEIMFADLIEEQNLETVLPQIEGHDLKKDT